MSGIRVLIVEDEPYLAEAIRATGGDGGIVAIDTLTVISLSLIALYAHLSGRFVYLDVALVYGLLSFLAVLAVARFLEKGP